MKQILRLVLVVIYTILFMKNMIKDIIVVLLILTSIPIIICLTGRLTLFPAMMGLLRKQLMAYLMLLYCLEKQPPALSTILKNTPIY